MAKESGLKLIRFFKIQKRELEGRTLYLVYKNYFYFLLTFFYFCLGTITLSSGSMATVVSSGGGGGMVKHVIQTPHHITIEEDEVPVPILISMVISVADPGCLSRILIFFHLGSRVQQEQQKKRRGEKFVLLTYFCSHKYCKTENYLI